MDSNCPVPNFSDLQQLVEANLQCRLCSLRHQATNVVAGVGRADADIVVIGEAPGAEEDESGLPFVGQAGKLLDSILEEAGVSRDDLYIHNVLSCRPPDNKFPIDNDAPDICRRWPLAEIEAIKPVLVVLLGSRATEFILGETGRLGGKIGQYRELVTPCGYCCKAIIMYHPSYLLRQGCKPGDDIFVKTVDLWKGIKKSIPDLISANSRDGELPADRVLNIFGDELSLISDPLVRDWCIAAWANAPEYAFHAAASISGKYHPQFALGEAGLIRHTKAVVYVVRRWAELLGLSSQTTNCVIAGALLHDIIKYGDTYGEKSERSYDQYNRHPEISAEHILLHKPESVDGIVSDVVTSLVRRHMGQWGAEPPVAQIEKLLHLADMLVSDRALCLDIFSAEDFDNEADYERSMLPERNVDVMVARKSTAEWFEKTFRAELSKLNCHQSDFVKKVWGRAGNVSVWDILLAKKLSMLSLRVFDLLPESSRPVLLAAALVHAHRANIADGDSTNEVADVINTLFPEDAKYDDLTLYPPQRMMFLLSNIASDPVWDYRIDERVFA
jgi:uracil-DNA glycosylase family 4